MRSPQEVLEGTEFAVVADPEPMPLASRGWGRRVRPFILLVLLACFFAGSLAFAVQHYRRPVSAHVERSDAPESKRSSEAESVPTALPGLHRVNERPRRDLQATMVEVLSPGAPTVRRVVGDMVVISEEDGGTTRLRIGGVYRDHFVLRRVDRVQRAVFWQDRSGLEHRSSIGIERIDQAGAGAPRGDPARGIFGGVGSRASTRQGDSAIERAREALRRRSGGQP